MGTAEAATANPGSAFAGPPADKYDLKAVDLRPDWDLSQALGLNVRTRIWTFQPGQTWHTVPESYRPPRYDLGRLERDLCRICRLPGFERTGDSGLGLCNQHASELRRLNLTLEQYLACDPAPLPTFGRCRARQNEADPCPRWATASTHRLCSVHSKRWRKLGKPDVDEWIREPQPIRETTPGNLIDLSGLNEVQFQQVCWAIQTDFREHVVVPIGNTKHAVNWLRDNGAGRAISDIDPSELEEVYWTRLIRWIGRARWALATGDDELQRPVIRLGVLDPKYRNRTVDISDVTQPWLVRLATLHIRHVAALGKGATKISEAGRLIRWWSAYLRTLGDRPPGAIMSDDACDGFARWLQRRVMDSAQYLKLEGLEGRAAALAQTERDKITARLIPPHPNSRDGGKQVLLMTASNRGNFLRQLNMILLTHIDYLRELGGHAPGWRVSKAQISSQEEEGRLNRQAKGLVEEDKALPSVVFDQLVTHLDLLGADGLARNAVESLMHLGRRPEDQMNFPFNCLAVVTDLINGEERSYPRLRYTDRLKDGKGGHVVDIPVFERAAAVIRRQQDWLRRTYPRWFDGAGEPLNLDLRLFPKSINNRDGTVPLSGSAVNSWIRQWVGKAEKGHAGIQRTPTIVGPDGSRFPLVRITAYALRHTFGQDLHDAGVPLDTIQKLMGHDTLLSTQVYARPTMADQWIGLKQLEQARSARITGDGNVVMLPIPTTLADHEEITRATMDCGSCAEKGNVARHGHACQYGHECLNCFFFRATVSDLPDLHRTRHRKARLLAQQRARLMPQGELANASAVKLQLEVERLDDLIATLEQEICSSDMVTEDDRQMIWDTLDRMERIDRELLEPMGAKRGPVRALVDERTFHPLAAAETSAAVASRDFGDAVTGKKPTRMEILTGGRMKAIDRNRARSGQARRRVEAVVLEMERTGRQLTNTAIHTLADVHENWLYEHTDVKAHADRVRAQIRQDKITAAATGQTELAEQLKTENAQLLARNKNLVNELRVVQQALAQARADQMDATISSAELDRVAAMHDRISDLEAANQKLILERNTALIEARRLRRDLSATQAALASAERRIAPSG